jgi:hypothetical protein
MPERSLLGLDFRALLKTLFRADAEKFCHKFCVKTAGILCVFQGFFKQKLGRKGRHSAGREFLEVPFIMVCGIYPNCAEELSAVICIQ